MKIMRAGNWLKIESTADEGKSATAIGLHMAALEELNTAEECLRAANIFERAGKMQWSQDSHRDYEKHFASAEHWTRLAKRYERRSGSYEHRLAEPSATTAKKRSAAVVVKGGAVVGYASVTYKPGNKDTEFSLGSDLVERIMPGAFDRALKEKHDVRALFNHDPNYPLARMSAGNLQLWTDHIGLRYAFDLPKSPNGENVRVAIARRDVQGSSFAFQVRKQQFVRGTVDVREIQDVDLIDVAPVTFPAYVGTEG